MCDWLMHIYLGSAESRIQALGRQIANVALNSTTSKVNKIPYSVKVKGSALLISYTESYVLLNFFFGGGGGK